MYTACTNPCPHTCKNIGDEAATSCDAAFCVEGCRCPKGMADYMGQCIAEEKCPCYYKGAPYPPNSTVIKPEICSKW